MTLDLSPTEMSDLRESLQSFTRQLLGELAHADQRQYRDMLRDKLRRYEQLLARLDSSAPTQPPLRVS